MCNKTANRLTCLEFSRHFAELSDREFHLSLLCYLIQTSCHQYTGTSTTHKYYKVTGLWTLWSVSEQFCVWVCVHSQLHNGHAVLHVVRQTRWYREKPATAAVRPAWIRTERLFTELHCRSIYTVNHKKRDILFLTITLANLRRFL